MTENRRNSLNEALKRREEDERERLLTEVQDGEERVLALDDTQRVKVLSPGRLVSKRFFRNKLAMVGLGILIFMFIFAFVAPLFYPYSQTQLFYKYDYLTVDYASATERSELVTYPVGEGLDLHYSVKNRLNGYIGEMKSGGQSEMIVKDSAGAEYVITELGENVYAIAANVMDEVAVYREGAALGVYDALLGKFDKAVDGLGDDFMAALSAAAKGGQSSFTFDGAEYQLSAAGKKNKYNVMQSTPSFEWTGEALGDGFTAAASAADSGSFDYDGVTYRLYDSGTGSVSVCASGERVTAMVASSLVFNSYEPGTAMSDAFKSAALMAVYGDGRFSADGVSYTVAKEADGYKITDAAGKDVAYLGTFVVRRYSGQDTLSVDFKEQVQDVIEGMAEKGVTVQTFTASIEKLDETASPVYDADGNPVYEDTEFTARRKGAEYVLTCPQVTYLIDIYAAPSGEHWFGTDGDGMDILARMMYGGRVSLMVGFVVIILEMILGIIMGGLAGFFGGWVDTLIMRLVDIFYCIPSMPILIILGAFFDSLKLSAYMRLVWMMAVLGILGWAGVARLVRGQILSLREQEFMVAEEATGMKARRRIFRHLVPNVMPQLIVSATMGLGSVIITESTLSFLGLGVKHPLATWGTMINSVTSSSESMIKYTYIWIPVGFLICLTVIAFNFVGDGLRDAFDPKMKQ
ncbi:MAG: ABC transporter permease [Oscillospiraceae bacterium]|nr:ABC transporter permease [Oscillospiraceae bacterium]